MHYGKYKTQDEIDAQRVVTYLKGLRTSKGLSQREVSDTMLYSKQNISKIEQRGDMTVSQYIAFCRSLGERPSEVMKIAECR